MAVAAFWLVPLGVRLIEKGLSDGVNLLFRVTHLGHGVPYAGDITVHLEHCVAVPLQRPLPWRRPGLGALRRGLEVLVVGLGVLRVLG